MNTQSLVTYKFKYSANEEANAFILKCMKQYSSLLHYGYNRVIDGWSAKQIKDDMKEIEGIKKSGDVVLLSPASASWDQYKECEIRGKEFKDFVKEL